MAYKKIGGLFPVLCQTLTGATGNTTFDVVNTGLSTTDRVGWLLKYVEDYSLLTGNGASFGANGDVVAYGLSLTNSMGTVTFQEMLTYPQTKWMGVIIRHDIGTAASGQYDSGPVLYNYDTSEDAGILMVPQPLFAFAGCSSVLNGAFASTFRCWFQAVQLSDQDYFNMLQANQMLVV